MVKVYCKNRMHSLMTNVILNESSQIWELKNPYNVELLF